MIGVRVMLYATEMPIEDGNCKLVADILRAAIRSESLKVGHSSDEVVAEQVQRHCVTLRLDRIDCSVLNSDFVEIDRHTSDSVTSRRQSTFSFNMKQ